MMERITPVTVKTLNERLPTSITEKYIKEIMNRYFVAILKSNINEDNRNKLYLDTDMANFFKLTISSNRFIVEEILRLLNFVTSDLLKEESIEKIAQNVFKKNIDKNNEGIKTIAQDVFNNNIHDLRKMVRDMIELDRFKKEEKI
jgi:hypothetical protein